MTSRKNISSNLLYCLILVNDKEIKQVKKRKREKKFNSNADFFSYFCKMPAQPSRGIKKDKKDLQHVKMAGFLSMSFPTCSNFFLLPSFQNIPK